MTDKYEPQTIEPKWQERWAHARLFEVPDRSEKPKFYYLDMFAYPSGDLHWGHVRNYTVGDVVARYHVMRGEHVLHPTGFDAFGLNAENAAIKRGIHPAEWTARNVAQMEQQYRRMGYSFDWSREVNTSQPDYYTWTQWMFLQLYRGGLAFKKRAPVNWCPSCATALANEQVIGGSCERCDTAVQQKEMEQWFYRITRYAERLLEGHDRIEWPDDVKLMQRNWIGRSEGVEFDMAIADSPRKATVYTTRPDTVFGITYMVLAPEHPLVDEITSAEQWAAVDAYREQARSKPELERIADTAKDGVFTGARAINPMTGEQVPVWVAEYVLMGYGTGAIMAVPAHDQRDFEFAKRYDLPIRVVINPQGTALDPETMTEAYVGPGVQVNSGPFDGLPSEEGWVKIAEDMERRGIGKRTVNYRLRDWLISRQRYWGAPIPIIYCDTCGTVPVPEEDLPVLLPPRAPFTGKGGSPLEAVPEFVNTTCPRCGGKARREVDTMDTFVCSSWYFIRHASPHDSERAFDADKVRYWLPVDLYIGGREHATMHLIYARFFCMALHDLGLVEFEEPFTRLFNHGVVGLGGKKMSKTRGDNPSPDGMCARYGADTARLFILFIAPPGEPAEWSEAGVEGIYRFLGRVWRLFSAVLPAFDAAWAKTLETEKPSLAGTALRRKTHQTITKVTAEIERIHHNTAVSALMEMVNQMSQFVADLPDAAAGDRAAVSEAMATLPVLLSPFAPHLADELAERLGLLGRSVSLFSAPWPQADPELAREDEITLVVQVNGKVRDRITVAAGADEERLKELALNSERAQQFIAGKAVRNVVVVPDKLVNIVVS
ncbi:MAG: leucine--tRNA ligase [Armatimonadota bacterium]|nr:MAG: leucine--tRNA ligase [Armatimonadota bacterium]